VDSLTLPLMGRNCGAPANFLCVRFRERMNAAPSFQIGFTALNHWCDSSEAWQHNVAWAATEHELEVLNQANGIRFLLTAHFFWPNLLRFLIFQAASWR
jgi:hypothetical protein